MRATIIVGLALIKNEVFTMALSARKKKILNDIINYLPSHRKGQISPADGGDIKLGDLLDGFRSSAAALAAITADPTDISVPEAEVGDLVIANLQTDDTGGTLGTVAGSVSADGTVSLDPENAPTNNDGTVLWVLLKAQS